VLGYISFFLANKKSLAGQPDPRLYRNFRKPLLLDSWGVEAEKIPVRPTLDSSDAQYDQSACAKVLSLRSPVTDDSGYEMMLVLVPHRQPHEAAKKILAPALMSTIKPLTVRNAENMIPNKFCKTP
jgi:hypothetical protein